MRLVQPELKVLSKEQIQKIHNYSLEILTRVGIRVDSPRARKIFGEALKISDSDKTVRIPAELVEQALAAAPTTVDIYDRLGNIKFQLGNSESHQTRFGIGVTNLYYQDPATDAVTPFTRRHMGLATRLGSALPDFDIISTVGVIQDMARGTADLYGALEMVANTTKPLIILVSERKCFDGTLNLLEYLHGDLSIKPYIIPYFNPITPLVLNEETTDGISSTIARGLPFIYNNYGMSGATSPITPASNLALLNAELLAGLVFSQLVKAGTPVIMGSLPAGFDMQNMTGVYSPRTPFLSTACAEMMAHYELPHSGTSGSAPGWGADLAASGALWMNHLAACMGQGGLAPFVGGNFDSLVFSPTLVVYSGEIIRQIRLFKQGFMLDDETAALSEIESIGPGGNFLISDQTVKLCREFNYSSSIWPQMTLEKWLGQGAPKGDEILRRHTCSLLNESKAPSDHADLISKGEDFIRRKTT